MQAVWIKMVTSSCVTSQRKNFGGTKCFGFKRATVFCLRHCLSKHKMTKYAAWPFWPFLATPSDTRKEWKRKNSTYLMFSVPRTKSSQQRKTLQNTDEKRYCQYWILSWVPIQGRIWGARGPRPSYFLGPTQVWPIWSFVWTAWKYAPLICSAPSKIDLLWFRLWFYDCLRSQHKLKTITMRSFLGIYTALLLFRRSLR